MTDPHPAERLPAISEVATDQLAAWFAARGEPAYRARQVASGVASGRAQGFDDLTDLPRRLRLDLAGAFRFSGIGATHVAGTDQGMTEKAVHELVDGQRVESVLMRYPGQGGSAARPVRDTRGRSIEASCGQLHAQLARRQLEALAEMELVPA